VVTSIVAYRQRHAMLAVVSAAGIALMIWTPIPLMPEHEETSASLLRQLVGGSYVWWAIVVIIVAGTVRLRPATAPSTSRRQPQAYAPTASP
jgi:alpha-1,2-mannosyltransferase